MQNLIARNDGIVKSLNDKKATLTPKKRLALSLATSAILATTALLDTAAAACNGRYTDGAWYIDCSGTFTTGDALSQAIKGANGRLDNHQNERVGINLNPMTVTSGSATLTFTGKRQQGEKFVIFRGVEAKNTDWTFDYSNASAGRGRHTIYLGYGGSPASHLKSLKVLGGNVNNGNRVNLVEVSGGSTIESDGLTIQQGQVANINIFDNNSRGTSVAKITVSNGASVGTLNLGKSGNIASKLLQNIDLSSATGLSNVNVYSFLLELEDSNGQVKDPLKFSNQTSVSIHPNSIVVVPKGGLGSLKANTIYTFNSLVQGGRNTQNLTTNQVSAGSGLNMELATTANGEQGFIIRADASTTYGANMYRSLVMSNMRRNAMTQNILDTMTTKTFHSDRYYNQEVELRLLQYDMSRLTNRSSKFSKTTRKNTAKIDKVREKIAKLTLEQSKGQNLDKGYNNFELIDQLDAIFIPYTGRRDWRFFALPYASYTYGYLAQNQTQEYAGGALFGVQRNLRANGILGSYLGYEFANTDTITAGADTRIQTHSLQAGINYFKTFSITSKPWEGFLRANVRGGVDLPNIKIAQADIDISSNAKNTSIPLLYNIGAEVKGGVTFYQYKRNSYVSPEVSLSYDVLSYLASMIDKPRGANGYLPLGPDEHTKATYWHLPQVGAAVHYYKMWGNKFRTNLKAGIKGNILSKQEIPLSLGDSGQIQVAKENRQIILPVVYGNLAFDMIWMVKKNHELSFGYDGLFFASTFGKDSSGLTSEWFNGVTTTLNFKYAYWFGGSDYVTDKDGNAVARSIVEGGKKKSKSKKSKKKKEKKSKKKVYYIDG